MPILIRRYFPFIFIIFLFQSQLVFSSTDFGPVDSFKIKNFVRYFGQYLDVRHPHFTDEEFGNKVRQEAEDVYQWLINSELPEKELEKKEFKNNIGTLFYYFSNIDLEGASEKAIEIFEGLVDDSDVVSYETLKNMTMIYASKGEGFEYECAVYAEKAIQEDLARATEDHMQYIAAGHFYYAGYFKKGYEYLKQQSEIDSTYKDTDSLSFAFDMWVQQWGEIPEKITFEIAEGGAKRPVPITP